MAGDLAAFKARLPIVEIVRRYVKLARNGPLWKGLCPFHNEKTPSFTVTESRGTYHCFGCGAHGNAIDFLIAIEGLEFAEAVRRAGELAGIEPPQAERRDPAAHDRSKLLVAALEAANAVYRDALAAQPGRGTRAYLERRGLEQAAIDRFELGYAVAGRTALTASLRGRGIALDVLQDAGLTIVPDDGGEPYDRFRDRLMFPIRDGRKRLVGFGGRALSDTAQAKYLNSPEGPLFKKRELLYGVHLLDRRAGRGTLHLVEGYMDVIALAEHGVAAVAPLGTAVTVEQLEQAWRLEPQPIVCLDGDAAGQRAGERLAELALGVLRPGLSLRFATVPEGDDPDSLVRRGGASALAAVTADAEPLAEALWRSVGGAGSTGDPDARALARRRLRELLADARDQDVRREYGRVFRERLGDGGGGALDRRPAAGNAASGRRSLKASLARVAEARASVLLGPLVLRPALLERFDEAVAELRFDDERFNRLKECLLDYALNDRPLETDALRSHLIEVGLGDVVMAVVSPSPTPTYLTLAMDDMVDAYRSQLEHDRRRRSTEAERELMERAWGGEPGVGSAEAVSRAVGMDSLLNPVKSSTRS